MILVFSFDDGDKLDVSKMAPLLKKYGYNATFYVPNYFKGMNTLSEDEIKLLIAEGHQIGGHTVNHPNDLKLLCCEKLKNEIEGNKAWLESVTSFPVESFCYPRGRYNLETVCRVKDAGFKTGRTTVVGVTSIEGIDYFKMPTTVHLFQRNEYEGVPLFDYFKQKLDEAEGNGEKGYMHIWGHSAEIEREGLWETFEEMLKVLNSKNLQSTKV